MFSAKTVFFLRDEWGINMLQRNLSDQMRQVKLLRVERLYQSGMPIAVSCRTVGISVHTYYKWCIRPECGAQGANAQIAAAGEQQESSRG